MKNNNNNGRGIFYGVIAVATLIVAIIGATFAYFTATANNVGTVQGEAAVAGLDLSVELMSTEAVGPMVPQGEAGLQSAVVGIDKTPDDGQNNPVACVDANNNTVCKVYKITVTNKGSSATVLTGTLNITAVAAEGEGTNPNVFTNLKWAELTGSETGTVGTTHPTSETTLASSLKLQASDGDASDNDVATYYVVVYINEIGSSQNDEDKGQFTGTVEFSSAAGTGVTSTFTS